MGLTVKIKVFFCLFMFVPRWAITSYLLWLGCRWLTATNDFADLILNAVALEFIMALKEFIYLALAPVMNMRECENTRMMPARSKKKFSYDQIKEFSMWN